MLRPARRLALAGLLLLAALPAASLALWHLARLPGPEALAAGVPLLALVWAWLLLPSRPAPAAVGPDPAWSWCGPLLCLLALAGRLLLPSDLALLLLPLLAAGLALAAGGPLLLRRLLAPVLLLFLAWPEAHLVLARLTTPPLLAWSAWCGPWLAQLGGATVVVVPGADQLLLCRGGAGAVVIGLDASCSGAGGVMAVLLLALPVLALRRPPWSAALPWLALGLALAALGNALRVGALCWLAAEHGLGPLFASVHAVAGSLLTLLVWGGLLAALPLLPAGGAPPVPAAPPQPRGALAACLPLLALVALADWWHRPIPPPPAPIRAAVRAEEPPPALVSATAPLPSRPQPPSPSGPPLRERPALELLPEIPGWRRWHHATFPWAAALFGPQARVERLVYSGPSGRFVWCDLVLADDAASLARHPVANCFDWHGYQVERASTWSLGPRLTAGEWVVQDPAQRRWAVLSWIQALEEGGVRRCSCWRRIDAGPGSNEQQELRDLAEGLAGAGPCAGGGG